MKYEMSAFQSGESERDGVVYACEVAYVLAPTGAMWRYTSSNGSWQELPAVPFSEAARIHEEEWDD